MALFPFVSNSRIFDSLSNSGCFVGIAGKLVASGEKYLYY